MGLKLDLSLLCKSNVLRLAVIIHGQRRRILQAFRGTLVQPTQLQRTSKFRQLGTGEVTRLNSVF